MKEIKLTQGYFALVDDDDHERVSAFRWYASVDKRNDGSVKNVYASRRTSVEEGRSLQYMHVFVMNRKGIDHKDHNGLNNQKQNLRPATSQQNSFNRRKRTNGKKLTSLYKGVSWHKASQKWQAHIDIGGQQKYLGTFVDPIVANQAYVDAAKFFQGDFSLKSS